MTGDEPKPKEEPKMENQHSYQTQQYVGQPAYQTQGYGRPYNNYPYKKLYRSTRDKWIAGVCGGIAEYYNQDPVLIRLLWIVLTIFTVPVGIIAYILLWIFIKKYPSYYIPPPPPEVESVHYHYYYGSPKQNKTEE